MNRKNLNLLGSELISVVDIEKGINPSDKVKVEIKYIIRRNKNNRNLM